MENDTALDPSLTLLSLYAQLADMVVSIEHDVKKNANGTLSAGPRIRKAALDAINICRQLKQASLDNDKSLKAARPKGSRTTRRVDMEHVRAGKAAKKQVQSQDAA